MVFALDPLGVCVSLVFIVLSIYFIKNNKLIKSPFIYFSSINELLPKDNSLKLRLLPYLKYLLYIPLFLLAIAFSNPKLSFSKNDINHSMEPPLEGLAIYLVVDRSGSMGETVPYWSAAKGYQQMSKIQILKDLTTSFIRGNNDLPGRTNDLFGIVTFARDPHILSPLTLDHQALVNYLQNITLAKGKEEDGTAIGYALYKTINLMIETKAFSEQFSSNSRPPYDIKNGIIVLITDGIQEPNPLDAGKRLQNIELPEVAELAKKEGIRLYIINIDPKINLLKFSPHRKQMEKVANLTGGSFFSMEGTQNLADIYQQIDELEKNTLPIQMTVEEMEEHPKHYTTILFFPYFIYLALFFLLIYSLLLTFYFRNIP